MKRIWWLAAVLATVACGSNPSVIPAGDFSGPTGLAIAPLPDRDLLFVANQGSNELRAIMLCTASSTCSSKDDQHFLPAPIRLFPGSILAGERPLRLAGAPLMTADRVPHGAVLVVGSDAFVRVIDAANVLAASQDKSVVPAPAKSLALPDLPVDVVATDVPGTSVTAIVATQPAAGGSAALTVLTVTLGPDGLVDQPAATQRCALDFVPARLALVPGDTGATGPQRVYVADATPGGTPGGIGDGAVEVSVPDIPVIPQTPTPPPTPPCPVTRRLPASDPADSPRLARPLRSLALSPAFTPDASAQPVAAGSLLLGATSEDAALCTNHSPLTCPAGLDVPAGTVCVDHGTRSCGRGRLVLISTNVGGQSALLPAPPTPLTTSGAAPMTPLSPPTPVREVAFMVTGLRLFTSGNVSTPLQPPPPLVGLASTEDGTTYLLDVVKRRFFNDLRDTGGPPPLPVLGTFTLTPAPPTAPPTLTLAPHAGAPSKSLDGWVNAGVTRSALWRAVWHGTMPRLESLGGNLSRAPGSPTVGLRLPPGKNLAPWTSAPELRLGAPSACGDRQPPDCVGDFVHILSYSRSDACAALGTVPATVDVPIAAIDPDGLGMQLQAVAGFDPGPECFASGKVGATVEVHAGTTTAGPWMVFEGLDALGRLPHGAQFVVTGTRFDYPLDPPNPNAPPPPPPARDVVVSFTVAGTEPTGVGTFFSFSFTDGQTITGIRDTTAVGLAGFGGPILVYSSARHPDPVFFTALTGSNSLLEATPAQFGVANANSVFFFY